MTLAAYKFKGEFMSDDKRIKELGSISGSSFLAIEVGVGIFRRHNPELMHYVIRVVQEGGSLIVIFVDKESPEGLGSLGKRPAFEVVMNANNLQVQRFNFVR